MISNIPSSKMLNIKLCTNAPVKNRMIVTFNVPFSTDTAVFHNVFIALVDITMIFGKKLYCAALPLTIVEQSSVLKAMFLVFVQLNI